MHGKQGILSRQDFKSTVSQTMVISFLVQHHLPPLRPRLLLLEVHRQRVHLPSVQVGDQAEGQATLEVQFHLSTLQLILPPALARQSWKKKKIPKK
jgi:hypothetical protein